MRFFATFVLGYIVGRWVSQVDHFDVPDSFVDSQREAAVFQ